MKSVATQLVPNFIRFSKLIKKDIKMKQNDYVEVPIRMKREVFERLLRENKCIEGTMKFFFDLNCIYFNAFNRKSREKKPERLMKSFEFGNMKRTAKRIKIWLSIPTKIGSPRICKVLNRETEVAKEIIMAENIQELKD